MSNIEHWSQRKFFLVIATNANAEWQCDPYRALLGKHERSLCATTLFRSRQYIEGSARTHCGTETTVYLDSFHAKANFQIFAILARTRTRERESGIEACVRLCEIVWDSLDRRKMTNCGLFACFRWVATNFSEPQNRASPNSVDVGAFSCAFLREGNASLACLVRYPLPICSNFVFSIGSKSIL